MSDHQLAQQRVDARLPATPRGTQRGQHIGVNA